MTRYESLIKARNLVIQTNFEARHRPDKLNLDRLQEAEMLLREALSPSQTIDEALDPDYIDRSLDNLD